MTALLTKYRMLITAGKLSSARKIEAEITKRANSYESFEMRDKWFSLLTQYSM